MARNMRVVLLRLSLVLSLFLTLSLAGCTESSPVPEGTIDHEEIVEPGKTNEREETTDHENIGVVKVIQTTVVRVVDGDTLEVELNGKKEKVRMIGVNTPETHHPTKPVEPFGPEAETFTRSQLEGRTVFLEIDVQERDMYGRILAYIWLSKPQTDSEDEVIKKMFNAKLLAEGYAQVMTIPPNVKHAELFTKLQAEAENDSKGLWGIQDNPAETAKTSEVPMGKGPNGETIKGNINSKGDKIYHMPGGQFYEATNPERWFFTEKDAQAAGFRKSKR